MTADMQRFFPPFITSFFVTLAEYMKRRKTIGTPEKVNKQKNNNNKYPL